MRCRDPCLCARFINVFEGEKRVESNEIIYWIEIYIVIVAMFKIYDSRGIEGSNDSHIKESLSNGHKGFWVIQKLVGASINLTIFFFLGECHRKRQQGWTHFKVHSLERSLKVDVARERVDCNP